MRILTITVRSRSSQQYVEETGKDTFVVHVKATPERGRSTKEALKLLANHLHLPFTKLMLTKKEGFDTKTILVSD